MKIHLRSCKTVEKEHELSKRQYMHTGHYPGVSICVAKEFFDLPFQHKLALIAHEIGHLLGGETEDEANKLAEKFLGVRIYYIDTVFFGKDLQWVSKKDSEKIAEKLEIL